MPEKVSKITQNTLLPLTLVIAIIGGVWTMATDRTKLYGAVENHEKRLTVVEQDLRAIREGVQRMEVKLGTAPQEKK